MQVGPRVWKRRVNRPAINVAGSGPATAESRLPYERTTDWLLVCVAFNAHVAEAKPSTQLRAEEAMPIKVLIGAAH
jgi:hypothetical protein